MLVKLNLEYSKIKPKHVRHYQSKINKLHNKIMNREGVGSEFTDWVDWPSTYDKNELNQMNLKVKDLKEKGVDTLLVIGIGGSFLGAKSAIDFIGGSLRNQDKVLFAGTDLSSDNIKQIEEKLENKNWAIAIISKSGKTLEPALSFRYFKSLLTKKHNENTKEYIVSITDKEKGALKETSNKEGYTTFTIPDGIGGRFSGITPVGLFPMAFIGIDIEKLLEGADQAKNDLTSQSDINKNIAYQYALIRNFYGMKRMRKLYPDNSINKIPIHWTWKFSKKYSTEVFVTWEPDLIQTSEWIKQLIGESLSKDGKGLFPSSATFTRDLHSLGQTFQDGDKSFFQTVLWVENPNNKILLQEDLGNEDGLNYLKNNSFNDINIKAMKAVTKAHAIDGNIPIIQILIKDKTEKSLGYLWYFFFLATTMSGYLEGVNPFDQPGVEVYKKEMFENLEENNKEKNGNNN